jgi:hypothetical protein
MPNDWFHKNKYLSGEKPSVSEKHCNHRPALAGQQKKGPERPLLTNHLNLKKNLYCITR